MRYNNYHKHDHVSNIFTPDVNVKPIDYINRIKELSHDTYFTTNHGSGGDIFESYKLCKDNDIHCKFGIEGYIVPDPLEKDKRNYHIIIIPVTNKARKKLNLATSRSNIEGYYYKPRLFLEDLLAFKKEELYITNACVGGLFRDEDSKIKIATPLIEHFEEHFLLEVQMHDDPMQAEQNRFCLGLSQRFGLKLIAANDSHYIYPEQSKERDELLKGKGIVYSDEDSYLLDYPDYDALFSRFQKQGLLADWQIEQAIKNTLLFDECEDIELDMDSVKMPTIYPTLTPDERIDELKRHISKKFQDICKEENITGDRLKEYEAGIQEELKVIEDTKELNTADYFLLNEKIVDLAVNKYGGVLTRTGRGSCGAFYLNRILGMTQLDRFTSPIKLYPERFMSTARLLENKASPDIDYNVVSDEPFIKASREVLGENGCYPMITYGTMKESEAFRNICRSYKLDYDEFNEVAKNIDAYRNDEKWKLYISEAQNYIGTIVSSSVHPCAYLLLDKNILEEYGVVRCGEFLCVMVTSSEADTYHLLKDDFLKVLVWKLISETFEMIGKPIMTVKELMECLDKKTYKILADGLTCTLNQTDSDFGTGFMKTYKASNVAEASTFTACLRPFFEPWRQDFVHRKPYTTGQKEIDDLWSESGNYPAFQESLMSYFQFLNVSPAVSIGLIKKISKKKIKPKDFEDLEITLKNAWIDKIGNTDNFQSVWELVQSCMSYGFCVSGDTKLYRNSNGKGFIPTVEEMYNIKNDRQYALKSNHLSLYKKYKLNGYGKTLSLDNEGFLKENAIIDIHFTGIQDVYLVTTESGATIKCTQNHKFPTQKGEYELKDLSIGDYLYVKNTYQKEPHSSRLTKSFESNTPKKGQCGFQKRPNGNSVVFHSLRKKHIENHDKCEMCECNYQDEKLFELHHKDIDRTNNDPSNLMWLCNSCHKKIHYENGRNKRFERGLTTKLEKIISIELVGEENVYTVTMDDPFHTFTVDSGIVTSNCSAHALATGIDMLYGAYLKAHYPLEYYTVCFNNYSDDEIRTKKLTDELRYFGIKLSNIKFRNSQATYSCDKENGTIYKGLSSIKYLNEESANQLYSIKDEQFNTFVALLTRIQDLKVDSRKLEILIKLDFFSEFGGANYLLSCTEIFNKWYGKKTIKKDKALELDISFDLIRECSGKETPKQFSELDSLKFINKLISNIPFEKETPLRTKIQYQSECLGYISVIDKSLKGYAVCTDLNVNYSPKVSLYALANGNTIPVKVAKKDFAKNPIKRGDIIKIKNQYKKNKMKKIDNEWVKSDELEWWVDNYEIV